MNIPFKKKKVSTAKEMLERIYDNKEDHMKFMTCEFTCYIDNHLQAKAHYECGARTELEFEIQDIPISDDADNSQILKILIHKVTEIDKFFQEHGFEIKHSVKELHRKAA